MDGIGLAAQATDEETVREGPRCSDDAACASTTSSPINVEITLNRYLDHDPEGRMYVLEEELERVRERSGRTPKRARATADPAASLGLQGDAIQPLTLRVNQGECLRISLRNELEGEPASLHIHGSSLLIEGSGRPRRSRRIPTVAAPGETVEYEWMVAARAAGGDALFPQPRRRARADAPRIVRRGHCGARGLEIPRSDDAARSYRAAGQRSSRTRTGRDFREFGLYYHEVGQRELPVSLDKDERARAAGGPDDDRAYRPGARALNYRSEPFMNRLQLQEQKQGRFDESVAYSSYVFGDPATPIMRSYLGDPVKERVIHGGSEVFHVHHVHGGAIRWRRQPDAEDTSVRDRAR